MPKRVCPFTEVQQAVKKHETGYGGKTRNIRSTASEKALQLLYLGATKQNGLKVEKNKTLVSKHTCRICQKPIESEIKCFYCDTSICCDCMDSCMHCQQDYCKKCVFITEEDSAVCYSCY